jgi:hypothetical protein
MTLHRDVRMPRFKMPASARLMPDSGESKNLGCNSIFCYTSCFWAFSNLSLVLISRAIRRLQTSTADPLQDRPVLVA